MILWKDFVMDDLMGPYLVCSEELGSRDIMEDVNEKQTIQEMRQEKAPARMVGSPGLDSNALSGMDAGPTSQAQLLQGRDG